MINSTFGGFMTARQGMYAAQHGLNLTGHNLTNSATTGYTRQRLDQVTLTTGGNYRYASQYNVNIGNGVLVTGTSQLRDPFLDLRYRNEMAHVGYENVKNDVLNDLADILDEVKNSMESEDAISGGGIFNQLGDILEKLQQLSNEVGNKEFDSMVKTSCQQLTTLLNSYSARIDEVEENLAEDLNDVDVPRVNEILKNISELNKSIMTSEIHGESALELKDQRNLLIDELSEYMKINVKYTPIQVSDTIVVDRLTISLVSSDANQKNINLVNHQQYRQLECEQNLLGDWNLTLTEMKVDGLEQNTPVDPDAEDAYNTAKIILNNATTAANLDTLVDTFVKAHNALAAAQTNYANAQTKVNDAQNAYTTATENWKTLDKSLTEERKKLSDLIKNKADAADIAAQETVVAQKQKDTDDAYADIFVKKSELQKAEQALNNDKKAQKEAETTYKKALENLPSDPANAIDPTTGNPTDISAKLVDDQGQAITKNLITGETLEGGNAATQKYLDAKDSLDAAEAAYNKSIEDSKAVTKADGTTPLVINDIFTDGKLRGTLEMLNCEGEYNGSDVRGIGYYRNMLNTFANTFANEMNKLNGTGKPLFTTKDGGTDGITADNIYIAQKWIDNEYGITASTQADITGNPVEGANDNILRFIMLFNQDISYTTGMERDDNKIELNSFYAQDADGFPIFLDKDGNAIEYDQIVLYAVDDGKGNTSNVTLKRGENRITNAQLEHLEKNGFDLKKGADKVATETDLVDNTIKLKPAQELFNGTFEEAFTNIGNTLGLDIKGTSENLANYEMLASNISAEREGTTGVSLDEEAMHIMQYQQSYNASARLMTALDEMLDTLISNTGVVGR